MHFVLFSSLILSSFAMVSPFFIPSMIANIAAGTIAIKHNAQGPSMCVVTACATSTHTIGEAFHAIRHG